MRTGFAKRLPPCVTRWVTLLAVLPNLLASPLAGFAFVLHDHDYHGVHAHEVESSRAFHRPDGCSDFAFDDHACPDHPAGSTTLIPHDQDCHGDAPLQTGGVVIKLPDQAIVIGTSAAISYHAFYVLLHVPENGAAYAESVVVPPVVPAMWDTFAIASSDDTFAILLRANHSILI